MREKQLLIIKNKRDPEANDLFTYIYVSGKANKVEGSSNRLEMV